MVRLVCELGTQLEMRQCDCNTAADGTYCAAVIVVCLVRYAMSAVWSLVLPPCVSCDCVLGLLQAAFCLSVLLLMSFDC